MSSFDIVKSWVPEETFRTAAVKAAFTLEDIKLQKRFAGELPIEGLDWKIGLIVGRSGTGKTSKTHYSTLNSSPLKTTISTQQQQKPLKKLRNW